MIKDLNELTVSQFVELVSGNTSVLCHKGEWPNQDKLSRASRDIIIQYQSIADPSGLKSFLARREEAAKIRMNVTALNICRNLMAMERYPETRDILAELGERADNRPDTWVKAKVAYLYEKAKRRLSELEEEEKETPPDFRRLFDEQSAALMAYFKFQIDPDTIKATVYAHLVARHNREIKSQLAAMKHK